MPYTSFQTGNLSAKMTPLKAGVQHLWSSRLLLAAAVLSLFTCTFALAGELPVKDDDFACVDRQKAERYISTFNIDIESFGGKELCKNSVDSKKLFNDLQLIEDGQFSGKGSNLFIRDFIDRGSYFSYLIRETRGIQRGSDAPFSSAYNSGGYFTMQDGWSKLSTLGRVGVVIHEARHTEGYGHTRCKQGPYVSSNVPGCDSELAEGGSHGIEMEYYARVVIQGTNFHPLYSDMARLMLLARANFVFNDNPLKAHDALLARTSQGLIRLENSRREEWTWSRDEAAALESDTDKGDLAPMMKRTSYGASFFEFPKKASSIVLKPSHEATLVSDDYSYYKLLKLVPPQGLRDFEEFDIANRRYVVALDQKSNLYSYTFNKGAWGPAVQLAGVARLATSSPDGASGIFAIFADETYCSLDPVRLNCLSNRNAWPKGARQFVNYQGSVLKLDDRGSVVSSSGAEWGELRGLSVLDFIKIPAYDVFEGTSAD